MITSNTIFYDADKNEYHVEGFIARGGFGEVYKIKSELTDELFALKTLTTPSIDEIELKSFSNEAKLAQQISHPNVIKYLYFHDGFQYNHLPMYIIMEYANGGTLRGILTERINNKQFYSSEELLAIFAQLAEGMSIINSRLVHRDIKPENILLREGIFKISDFGISKIVLESTRHTTFKGFKTYAYTAPEAWKFEANTPRMDIYSMGIIFYELASLAFPYYAKTGDAEEWRSIHLFQAPKNIMEINPTLSPVICNLIMKMLEKEVHRRLQNWEEIHELLKKGSLPETINKNFVNTILIKRNEREQKATEARLRDEKKRKEIADFKELVLYQYHKDIISPLNEFIKEINSISEGTKIIFHHDGHSFLNTIMYGQTRISLNLNVVLEDDFYRDIQIKEFGEVYTRKELRVPKVDKKRVFAWGLIKGNDGRGFNIILREKPESIYGEWLLLFNRHRIGLFKSGDNPPEPFPFELNELEKELIHINSAHIFVTDVCALDLDKIKEFLSNYF